MDKLDAGPYAAGVLPAAAASTQPLPEDGARGHQPAVLLFKRSGERADLAGCAHADGDDAGQKAGGDGQARAFGNIVHAADNLNAVAWPSGQALKQCGQGLRCSFDAGRNNAAGDDARLEQAKVVAGKVEDLGDRGNIGGGLEINAGEPNDGLIDDAEPGLDGRSGLCARPWPAAAEGEIDGDVENARAFGIVHAEEENVAPSAVSQVHAHRSRLAQDGKNGIAGEKFRPEAEGIVVGVAGAEHPLVAADAAHTAAHLVGKSLEAERTVAGGKRTGDGGAGAMFALGGEKDFDGFFKAALGADFQIPQKGSAPDRPSAAESGM